MILSLCLVYLQYSVFVLIQNSCEAICVRIVHILPPYQKILKFPLKQTAIEVLIYLYCYRKLLLCLG